MVRTKSEAQGDHVPAAFGFRPTTRLRLPDDSRRVPDRDGRGLHRQIDWLDARDRPALAEIVLTQPDGA